ncbi:hypothetical protein ACNKHV_05290 [Shigella flexneri]
MGAIVARQDNFHKTSLMGRLLPEHSQPSTKSFAKIKGASVKQGYARQIRSAEIAEVQNYNLLHIYF